LSKTLAISNAPLFYNRKLSNSAVFLWQRACRTMCSISISQMCLSTWQAVDAEELQPLDTLAGGRVLVAVAALFGSVRLIDNVVLEPT
jgi:pantothenate synthetase